MPALDSTPTRKRITATSRRYGPQSLLVTADGANSAFLHSEKVIADVCQQLRAGEQGIMGVMVESNLAEGAQKAPNGREGLKRGVSITDACVSWETTKQLLHDLNDVRPSPLSLYYLRALSMFSCGPSGCRREAGSVKLPYGSSETGTVAPRSFGVDGRLQEYLELATS